MGVDNSDFLACSYGNAGFMLETYTYEEEPILKDGVGRVGTQFTATCSGFFDAETIEEFNEKFQTIVNAMRTDGQNFTITGLNEVAEVTILAAECFDGGPFCKFKIKDGDNPMQKRIDFTLTSPVPSQSSGGSSTPPAVNTYKAKTAIGADGLKTITWSGQLNGVGSQSQLLSTTLPSFLNAYSGGNWVAKYEYESSTDPAQTTTTYTLTATQNANPLPTDGGAVDGDATVRIDIDEQSRKVTSYEFDFLITSDPFAFHQNLRSTIAGGDVSKIYRESYAASTIKGVRVKSSFTVVESGEGDNLISWTQTFRVVRDEICFEELTFPGADPIAVQRPKTLGRLTQSGTAVGLFDFPSPPDPIFAQYLTQPREVTYAVVNREENQTTWSYVMLASDPTDLGASQQIDLTVLVRPTTADFSGNQI